jgi:hypothetical protein
MLIMTSRSTPATAEQPTPNPRSAVVANDRPGGLGIDPAAVASIEELPRDLRDNPFVAYLMGMTPDHEAYLAARSVAAEEGRKLYGDESSDAWLAALESGTHPLCGVSGPLPR